MPDIGFPELLVILFIVLLIFGPGRLGKALGELGKGVRSFREGLSGSKEQEKPEEKQESEALPHAGSQEGKAKP
jgi:sec-independent protein translocase protein TatA